MSTPQATMFGTRSSRGRSSERGLRQILGETKFGNLPKNSTNL